MAPCQGAQHATMGGSGQGEGAGRGQAAGDRGVMFFDVCHVERLVRVMFPGVFLMFFDVF